MLIGELARRCRVPTQTIRFYERRGLMPEPRRAPNGYRAYDVSAVERLEFIRSAQGAGLTLAEIAGIISVRESGVVPCAHVGVLLEERHAEVRRKLGVLQALQSELESLMSRSRRLDPANCAGSSVCQILEM